MRYRERPARGPARFVFESDDDYRTLAGVITAVTPLAFGDLDSGLQEGLRGHHPGIRDDATVSEVAFEVVG